MDQKTDGSFDDDQRDQNREASDPLHAYLDAFAATLRASLEALDPQDQWVIEVSCSLITRNWQRFERLVEAQAATEGGLEQAAELALHNSIYAGATILPRAHGILSGVAVEYGRALELEPLDAPDTAADRSAEIRRSLHGLRHDVGHADPDDPVTWPLYGATAELGYGLIWSRPGLSLRHRLICAVASLSLTGPDAIFVKFCETALAKGIPAQVLKEAVMLGALYQGTPRALQSLSTLRPLLGEAKAAE